MTAKKPHTVTRTNSDDPDFHKMILLLEQELRVLNGSKAQDFFEHFNIIKDVDTVVLGYLGEEVVGCGCFKKFDDTSVELKRMFVLPAHRGEGIAYSILQELEKWAQELGSKRLVLETGSFLHNAVKLYKRHGYQVIDNWGQYIGIENSICMSKQL